MSESTDRSKQDINEMTAFRMKAASLRQGFEARIQAILGRILARQVEETGKKIHE